MIWQPGWHSLTPLTPSAPAFIAESRSDEIEVTFTHRTVVDGRSYRSGSIARLDERMARALFAANTISCVDASEPERRGFKRILVEGREQRMAKQPTSPWTTLNKILPVSKQIPASGPPAAMPRPKPEPPVKVPAPVKGN